MDEEGVGPSSSARRLCGGSGHSSDSDEAPLIPPVENAVRIRMPSSPSDPHHKFPKEPGKTIISCALLVTAGVMNDVVLSFVHEKVPPGPPLPDFFFDLGGYYANGLVISEYIMLSVFFSLLVLILFHRHRWIVLRRLGIIGSLLYAGRCVTMFVTPVPVADPNYFCSPKLGENATVGAILLRALSVVTGLGLKLNGKHTLCGDYIYSGHTIVLVITALFVGEYSPRRWRVIHVLYWMLAMAGMGLLILSRGHYTIDVIISYFLCTRLFWTYHTHAANPSLRISPHNHQRKEFWWCLFEFMEGSINRPLPRRFDSPISLAWIHSLRHIARGTSSYEGLTDQPE